jgi:hypothetical protein
VSVDEAADAIERVWLDNLRYRYLEHHEWRVEAGTRVFHLVTQMRSDDLSVTGKIELPRCSIAHRIRQSRSR